MKPSEIVEGAIEILDEKGWCQGGSYDLDGRVCVGEALVEAALSTRTHLTDEHWYLRLANHGVESEPVNTAATTILQEAKAVLADRNDSMLHDIVNWNDETSDLTIDQVKDTMMTAAKTLRNRGE